jgi:hypothetical protein
LIVIVVVTTRPLPVFDRLFAFKSLDISRRLLLYVAVRVLSCITISALPAVVPLLATPIPTPLPVTIPVVSVVTSIPIPLPILSVVAIHAVPPVAVVTLYWTVALAVPVVLPIATLLLVPPGFLLAGAIPIPIPISISFIVTLASAIALLSLPIIGPFNLRRCIWPGSPPTRG